MDSKIMSDQEICACKKRCSASFIIREMHLLTHCLSVSVPALPISSIVLLSYFNFFTIVSRTCLYQDPQEELLSHGIEWEAVLKLFLELPLSPKLMPCPRQHHANTTMALLRFSAEWREGWLSTGHLVLSFSDHHCYLLTHAKHVICSISFNLYHNSMKVGIFIFFSQMRKLGPQEWPVSCLRSYWKEMKLGFVSSFSDFEAWAFHPCVTLLSFVACANSIRYLTLSISWGFTDASSEQPYDENIILPITEEKNET